MFASLMKEKKFSIAVHYRLSLGAEHLIFDGGVAGFLGC